MNKKRIYIISSTLLLIGLFAGVVQYVGMFDALYAAAINPGHSWSQMECSTALCIDTTNNRVGVGTMTPQTTFDVNGAIKIGESTTCNSSLRGAIKYSGGAILICNGTSWTVTSATAPYQGDDFTDSRDGEVYKTVVIGGKTWMAENLRYMPAPATSISGNNSSTDPRYYFWCSSYTFAQLRTFAQYRIYGILYNRPAALSACPSGWHLPSNDEMNNLELSLGMSLGELNSFDADRGVAIKMGRILQGTTTWVEADNVARVGYVNNVYFNLPPAGYYYGNCDNSLTGAALWTSTPNPNSSSSNLARMFSSQSYMKWGSTNSSPAATWGASIRCVKD